MPSSSKSPRQLPGRPSYFSLTPTMGPPPQPSKPVEPPPTTFKSLRQRLRRLHNLHFPRGSSPPRLQPSRHRQRQRSRSGSFHGYRQHHGRVSRASSL